MAKYVEDFNEWALSMYDEYMKVSRQNRARWKVCRYVDKYSVVTTLIDLKEGKCGSAKAMGKEYREKVGIGVAWARLRGYEVPKERKKTKLEDLADYDKFSLFSLVELEDIVCIKIGEIPETKEIVIYEIKENALHRLDRCIMVYKMN